MTEAETRHLESQIEINHQKAQFWLALTETLRAVCVLVKQETDSKRLG